ERVQGGVDQSARIGNLRNHQRIGFDVFEYGIIKRRVIQGFTEEAEDWRTGHPVLFPNILLVGDRFISTLQFRVPIDDERTFHVSLYTFRAAPGTRAAAQESVPFRYVPLYNEAGDWNVAYTFNQDYMAWVQQGPIAERHREKLGESDKGIILFRRQLKQQLDRLQNGLDPMNVFRDPSVPIRLPVEVVKVGGKQRPIRYIPGEAGYSADSAKIEATQATWDVMAEARV
ncbi:MAG: hypothetical protein AAB289_15065, partial [Chloroflexota bacterium]